MGRIRSEDLNQLWGNQQGKSTGGSDRSGGYGGSRKRAAPAPSPPFTSPRVERPAKYRTQGAAHAAATPQAAPQSTAEWHPINTRELKTFDRLCSDRGGHTPASAAWALDRTLFGIRKAQLRFQQAGRATPTKGRGRPGRKFSEGSAEREAAHELLYEEEPHLSLAWAAERLDTSPATLSREFGTGDTDTHRPRHGEAGLHFQGHCVLRGVAARLWQAGRVQEPGLGVAGGHHRGGEAGR